MRSPAQIAGLQLFFSAAILKLLSFCCFSCRYADPLSRVVPWRKIQVHFHRTLAVKIESKVTFHIRKGLRDNPGCMLDGLEMGSQVGERKRAQKVAQNSKLLAECRAAAAWAVWRGVRAILVSGADGIVEVIENAPAGEHEIPGWAEVGGVLVAQVPVSS